MTQSEGRAESASLGFISSDYASFIDAPLAVENQSTPDQMASAITTVVRNAIDEYHLIGRDVAGILHVSPSFVSRLHRGQASLAANSDAYERAVMLVRTIDALGSLIGHPAQVREFLYGPHEALGAPPIDLMQRLEGLVDVTRYFESRVH
ncbi:hypothetical protein ACS8YF_07200 [Salinisphaera sp. SWV1]|uniref:hypothetical protein n=1 Tax=Salinisphaera sp. SWV1 TaxID=3454139 RepID=UPI003F83D10C